LIVKFIQKCDLKTVLPSYIHTRTNTSSGVVVNKT